MRDEDATNLAVDADPRALAEVAEAPAPGDPDGDDTEEVEHDGQVYRIPRALKGAFLMHGDYTRKTQELRAPAPCACDEAGCSPNVLDGHST